MFKYSLSPRHVIIPKMPTSCTYWNPLMNSLTIIIPGIPTGFKRIFMLDINRHTQVYASLYRTLKTCLLTCCKEHVNCVEKAENTSASRQFWGLLQSSLNELFAVVGSYCFYYESPYGSESFLTSWEHPWFNARCKWLLCTTRLLWFSKRLIA